MRTRLVLPAGMLAALLLAACTPSTDDGDATSPAPTDPGTVTGGPGITLTIGDTEEALELTEVECAGEPGSIAHVRGSTDGEPPLVEAGADRFVMVHLGTGEPHRSENPSGVSYAEESVTFSDVALSGDARLNGTLECTAWED